MLKVRTKKTIPIREAVERYENLNEIVVANDKKHGNIYKLSRVGTPTAKFALVSIDGDRWANGFHKEKKKILERFLKYDRNRTDEILVFEDEKEYAEWLIDNV